MILLGYSAITLHKRKVEVKMCFKSSRSVFKSKDSDFLLTYTLQSIDFKSISRNIYSTYYKNTNSKNTPYEPTSLLRLLLFTNSSLKSNVSFVTKIFIKSQYLIYYYVVFGLTKIYLLILLFTIS